MAISARPSTMSVGAVACVVMLFFAQAVLEVNALRPLLSTCTTSLHASPPGRAILVQLIQHCGTSVQNHQQLLRILKNQLSGHYYVVHITGQKLQPKLQRLGTGWASEQKIHGVWGCPPTISDSSSSPMLSVSIVIMLILWIHCTLTAYCFKRSINICSKRW